jgi:hypothetical protein
LADVVRTAFALSGIMLVSGAVVPISTWFRDLCCVLAFFLSFLAAPSLWKRTALLRLVILAGFTAGVALSLIPERPASRLALLALVVLIGFWVERPTGRKWRDCGGPFPVLGLALLLYASFVAIYAAHSFPWYAIRRLSGLLSAFRPVAGYSLSRAAVYVFGSIALILAGLLGSWKRAGISLLILFAGFVTSSRVLALIAPLTLPKLACLKTALIIVVSIAIVQSARAAKRPLRSRGLLASTCAVIAILIVLRSAGGGVGHPETKGRSLSPCSIALYSEGLFDWKVPVMDRHGLVNSGMFGLFRKSLERHAGRSGGSVSEIDSLTPSALCGQSLVVFVNPTRRPSLDEEQALAEYVKAGGGLLVLGDHTDIGGSRRPLNGILGFTSIRFNFDSAIPIRQGWFACLEMRAHPVTVGLKDAVDTQLGVGASLEISPPAFPIIIGAYGYSDVGDYHNAGRGAFMGNCRHEEGETPGDLVLVAGEEVGKGRVLVFGDTSPFQNGALFLSRRFVSDALNWAWGRDPRGLEPVGARSADGVRPFEDIAVIDFSHNPGAARRLFTEDSVGGLANCLYRAGITPVPVCARPLLSQWAASGYARFIILVSPSRTLSGALTDGLIDYMRSGGRVVIAKGHSVPEPCENLFKEIGVGIQPVPLGNGDEAAGIRHKDAWPVTCSSVADTCVHATAFGRPTAVSVPVGRGGLTLVGDGRLLVDVNLEGETQCIDENVAFVTAFFRDLKESRLESLAPKQVLAGRDSD